MARSQKDDPFNEIHRWKFSSDQVESEVPVVGDECASRARCPTANPHIVNETGNRFGDTNTYGTNSLYNKSYNMNLQAGDLENTNNSQFDTIPTPNRMNNYPNYALFNLDNGKVVKVLYDENNQVMMPVTNQYELFSQKQGLHNIPIHNDIPNQFIANQDFQRQNNADYSLPVSSPTGSFGSPIEHPNIQISGFLDEVLGNWMEPNVSGTYSHFGQNYPLNHPEVVNNAAPVNTNITDEAKLVSNQKHTARSPKRQENSPLADNTKKRIVAEVKPMRPTYSDVLAKNAKTATLEQTRKTKTQCTAEVKNNSKINNSKSEKPQQNGNKSNGDDGKQKSEKSNKTTSNSHVSSGSDSGDVNTDDNEKQEKTFKRNKGKRTNMSRKWSSLDDINNEENSPFISDKQNSYPPQFVFIQNQTEKTPKKDRKSENKSKNVDDHDISEQNSSNQGFDPQFCCGVVFQDNIGETKIKKKSKETRASHKTGKTTGEKKKSPQVKGKRNKPSGYIGALQNYLENWTNASWKAMVWFWYLLMDVCHMSAHLSFDLCTSIVTQTYVSSQAVYRSSKNWFSKFGDNKYLLYIDRKFGHTKLGFWRKIKWFKKVSAQTDPDQNDPSKLNTNIPLPSTGEEAMKRLLACKGKDPYSILGVNPKCTDDDIKRYYRRQAFLVHPDKNQQPGAEEAFKILQHAFDLIGEPERRSAYERRTLESRHVEAAWSELSQLLAQLHDKMEFAANTIRCTNCGRRHKRVLTDRPCYAARYCSQCKIRHSAKEGDIWAESGMFGMLVMYYACMDGAVYQITQWASCQKKNLKQLKPDCHLVQYRIVLGNKAGAAPNLNQRPSTGGPEPNLEEFLNNLYSKSGAAGTAPHKQQPPHDPDKARRRKQKTKP